MLDTKPVEHVLRILEEKLGLEFHEACCLLSQMKIIPNGDGIESVEFRLDTDPLCIPNRLRELSGLSNGQSFEDRNRSIEALRKVVLALIKGDEGWQNAHKR